MNTEVLKNKVVAITGAGSGIGRELAVQLSQTGCKLAISDKNEETLRETKGLLAGEVLAEVVDVSAHAAVEAHAQNVLRQYGHVDVVVNNAGADLSQYLSEVTLADFKWLMDVNFWGVVYGTKAYLPGMLKRKEGTIVNVSSILGIVGVPAHGTYVASKFAVRGFSESLRFEMLQHDTGVNVISVHPGAIATNIVRNARFYKDHNGGSSQEHQAAEFDEMAGTSAAQAAKQIIQGIVKKSPRVIIGKDAWLVEKIQRLFPESYIKILLFLEGLKGRKQPAVKTGEA